MCAGFMIADENPSTDSCVSRWTHDFVPFPEDRRCNEEGLDPKFDFGSDDASAQDDDGNCTRFFLTLYLPIDDRLYSRRD